MKKKTYTAPSSAVKQMQMLPLMSHSFQLSQEPSDNVVVGSRRQRSFCEDDEDME
jgi:hypothetical protein